MRPVFQATVVDDEGNVIPEAEITVYDAGTLNLATIYSTAAGGALTNPFDADVEGFFQFYADSGRYDIEANGGITWDDEVLFSPTAPGAIGGGTPGDGTFETLQSEHGEVYARGNILGTVSQSGGVPTGAIIQRGSNSNGEFVRYADGTLICTLRVVITSAALRLTISLVPETNASWTFPSAFVSEPAVFASAAAPPSSDRATENFGLVRAAAFNNTTGSIVIQFDKAASNTKTLQAVAIGRWF